jgi:enoyl-CoA hydratase/carnithine racemase
LAERLVVGVHGRCIGAGIELSAFATTVIATESASFLLPELTLGLNLGAGGTLSLPRRIGRHRTFALLLESEPIDAFAARACGLVDEIVASAGLRERCLAAAEALR